MQFWKNFTLNFQNSGTEPQKKKKPEKLWVGVEHICDKREGSHACEYRVELRKEDLSPVVKQPTWLFGRDHTVIAVKALLPELSNRLRDLLSENFNAKKIVRLGSIEYRSSGETAISRSYWPKSELPKVEGGTRGLGLGYFLEAIAVKHLQKLDFSEIKTTEAPVDPRLNQLKKIKLKPDTPYPIRTWLLALGFGIKKSIRKKSR